MRIERTAFGGVLVVVLLALIGCGGETMVSGKVNVDGQPIEDGAITFFPMDGKTATAGGTIKDGQYSAKVPVGRMKVTISKPKVVGTKKLYPTPDSPTRPVTAESLPAKYNAKTELEVEVNPGANVKDFDLHSK